MRKQILADKRLRRWPPLCLPPYAKLAARQKVAHRVADRVRQHSVCQRRCTHPEKPFKADKAEQENQLYVDLTGHFKAAESYRSHFPLTAARPVNPPLLSFSSATRTFRDENSRIQSGGERRTNRNPGGCSPAAS
ncbi:hypothetical protein D9C73_013702 [Collichthys lucidus]|uniref:Uncharacterized protein n=1 Tax=Collichthys lucidus TaxID=240159 RepID=A0A4U5V1G0_COLLU|nr:hypothetical protein D9C73_013702 [Collichthys lucidus]